MDAREPSNAAALPSPHPLLPTYASAHSHLPPPPPLMLLCVAPRTPTQVILKPDPGNPQELYLGSLEALGIDTRAHDVRFVEDNWESPVLGAWGLGWEVRAWVGRSVG